MGYVFEQSTGKLRDSAGNVIGIGYSGDPLHKNDPAAQNLVAEGPIPQGTYTIAGPPFNSASHGPFCLKLVPDDATTKFIASLGRDPFSFLMHGDSLRRPGDASEGCIILDRMTRESVAGNLAVDNSLQVVSGITNPDIDGEISV